MATAKEKAEIRELYRTARDKRAEIRILQQLYLLPKNEIKRILGLLPEEPKKQLLWYSPGEKAQLLEARKKGLSNGQIAAKYGIPAGSVDNLIKRAEDEAAAIPAHNESPRRSYSPEFKREIQAALAAGMQPSEVAEKFGANINTVKRWKREGKQYGQRSKKVVSPFAPAPGAGAGGHRSGREMPGRTGPAGPVEDPGEPGGGPLPDPERDAL